MRARLTSAIFQGILMLACRDENAPPPPSLPAHGAAQAQQAGDVEVLELDNARLVIQAAPKGTPRGWSVAVGDPDDVKPPAAADVEAVSAPGRVTRLQIRDEQDRVLADWPGTSGRAVRRPLSPTMPRLRVQVELPSGTRRWTASYEADDVVLRPEDEKGQ